jgi:hypothetical protein
MTLKQITELKVGDKFLVRDEEREVGDKKEDIYPNGDKYLTLFYKGGGGMAINLAAYEHFDMDIPHVRYLTVDGTVDTEGSNPSAE